MLNKKWILAIDADGCIYNSAYHFMLLYVLDRYDELFANYSKGLVDYDYLLNLIQKDIQNLNLYHSTTNGIFLDNKLHKRGSRHVFNLMKKEGLDPDVHDKRFMSDYIALKKQDCLKKIYSLGDVGKVLIKTILTYSNKPLIDSIVHLAISSNFKKLIIVSGSNRQSKSLDKQDSEYNGTGLFANDLPLINEILNGFLNPYDIYAEYDHFSTTKVYHSEHPVFDRTKLTLLYALLQHYGKKINESVPVTFIDNREEIRESVTNVFDENRDLIRKGMELNIWPYDGSLRFNFPIIKGCGPVDFNYKANIKKLVEMCGYDLKKNDCSVDVANQLSAEQFQKFTEGRILSKATNDLSLKNISLFSHSKPRHQESILDKLGLKYFLPTN